jgi:integrase
MIFSILRDTGLRPIELHRLTLRDIDLDKGIIHPSTAKGGKARVLKLKKPTLAMLKEYPLFSNVILYPQKRGFISQTKMINAMSSKIANYECP